MADLSAVLRKTIDALPSATPQLRAKVYEKARAAVRRQIDAANPPLPAETVEARLGALEDAIEATERHYTAGGEGVAPGAGESARIEVAPPSPPARPAAPPVPPVERVSPRETGPIVPPPVPPRPAAPEPRTAPAERRTPPAIPPERHDPYPHARDSTPIPEEQPVSRVGEIGPMSTLPAATATDGAQASASEPESGRLDDIPSADISVPGYARPRPQRRSRAPMGAGLAVLLVFGALGAAGYAAYVYQDELTGLFTGEQVAEGTPEAPQTVPVEETAATDPAAETPATAAAPDPGARQFTQRLQPDGTEIDEGPAERTTNAFDEGTDVAAASLVPGEATPAPAGEAAPTASAAEATVAEAAGAPDGVEGGQRAVFYEERSTDRPGAQHGGNVVWSVVNEPPATGQPPEPAIRAVAEVADTQMRMTMTIRRNADETLPASHVIELLFDTPADFAGGEIENVQRLALKPSEQDRGEPLIGVAGKISDGFFIIALNDLQQAVDNNLALMANQEWIDIPMAYATGQRALISLEKGGAGDEVFREALAAWASRT